MIRSLLYVPAHAEKFIARAHERHADAIILDLEDSVPPSEKARARALLAATVPAVGRGGALVFVRVNPHGSEGFAQDVDAAISAGAFGLLVPKVRDGAAIASLDAHLARIESACERKTPVRLVPMIEDPGAVLDARAIARASRRNLGLMTGSEDLATSMGGQPTPDVLRLPKLLVHLAAKAEGLLSFGLLRSIADYQDTAGIAHAAAEARAHGFDGASCIHPSAVAILNRAFAPTAEEIDRARRMVAAYEAAMAEGKGAVVHDGRMIDLPVVERARRLIASARGDGA